MVSAYARLPMSPAPSVAVTVKVEVPVAAGIPPSAPDGPSDSPPGRAPEVTAKVNGPGGPVAATAWPYATPICPAGSAAGDTTTGGAGSTVRVYARLPEASAGLVAVAAKSNVPAAVGVPVSAPEPSRASPAGRL